MLSSLKNLLKKFAEAILAKLQFNTQWYEHTNPDVTASGMPAFVHFLRSGWREGRHPSPWLCLSAYQRQRGKSGLSSINPWWHYVFTGQWLRSPLPQWQAGEQPERQGHATLLVVAHQAGSTLFGAERSLLDMLAAFNALPLNVCVVLPSAENEPYTQQVLALAHKVVFMPIPWWRYGRPVQTATVQALQQLGRAVQAQWCYVNTAVLWEPALAAQQLGIPCIAHVREVFQHDEHLCTLLGCSPQQAVEQVQQHYAALWVNSQFTAAQFATRNQVTVVRNVCEPAELLALPINTEKPPALCVGMVSSNVAKKGVADFFTIANAVKQRWGVAVRFELVGPITETVEQCEQQWPGVVTLHGYVQQPSEAYSGIDVVLSLSHFAESFGRTVAEAMAAGKVVLAYEHGAVGELISHQRDGYLTPWCQPEAAAQQLNHIIAEWPTQTPVREAARARVLATLSRQHLLHTIQPILQPNQGQHSKGSL